MLTIDMMALVSKKRMLLALMTATSVSSTCGFTTISRSARQARNFGPSITNPSVLVRAADRGGYETLSASTIPQLKDELRKRGLRVGGRKAELIDRLLGAAPATGADVPVSNDNELPADAIVIEACKS